MERKNVSARENTNDFLRCIFDNKSLTIDTVDSWGTLADADDVFKYIDDNFRNRDADELGSATEETLFAGYEMVKDGIFMQLFGSLSDDMQKLCFTQAQIIEFMKKHRGLLRTDGYATFFLLQSKGHLFVAHVKVFSGGGLRVYANRFKESRVWRSLCRHRIVVPQLA